MAKGKLLCGIKGIGATMAIAHQKCSELILDRSLWLLSLRLKEWVLCEQANKAIKHVAPNTNICVSKEQPGFMVAYWNMWQNQ